MEVLRRMDGMEEIEEEGSSLDSPTTENIMNCYICKKDAPFHAICKGENIDTATTSSKSNRSKVIEKQKEPLLTVPSSRHQKQKSEIDSSEMQNKRKTKPTCQNKKPSRKHSGSNNSNNENISIEGKIPEISLQDDFGIPIRIAIGEEEEEENRSILSLTQSSAAEDQYDSSDVANDENYHPDKRFLKIHPEQLKDLSATLPTKSKLDSPLSSFSVQVTLHRPLNWQVSASSSSSSITQKSKQHSENGNSLVKHSMSGSVSFSISPVSTLSKESYKSTASDSLLFTKDKEGIYENRKFYQDLSNISKKPEKNLTKCSTVHFPLKDTKKKSISTKDMDKPANTTTIQYMDGCCKDTCQNWEKLLNPGKTKCTNTIITVENRQRKVTRVKRIHIRGASANISSSEERRSPTNKLIKSQHNNLTTGGVSDRELLPDALSSKDKFKKTHIYQHHLHHEQKQQNYQQQGRRRKKRQLLPHSSSSPNISDSFSATGTNYKCTFNSSTETSDEDDDTEEGPVVTIITTPTTTTTNGKPLTGILKTPKKPNPNFAELIEQEVNKENLQEDLSERTSRRPRRSRSIHIETDCCNDFPTRESHGVQDCQAVMTWFKEPVLHVNNKESGMGANGSTHNGRLKSRSQSSSALYCIGKASNGGTGQSNNYENYHSANANGLSTSIPADIWDLPATAKSYSPITHNKHNSNNQNHKQNLKNRTAAPVVDAIASRNARKEKDEKLSGGPRKVNGSNGEDKRSKLYAISCPDVAQHTQNAPNSHPVYGNEYHHHNQHSYSSERGIETAGLLDSEDDYTRMCRLAHPHGSHNDAPDAHHSYGDINFSNSSTIPPPSSFASSTSNINTCTYSHCSQQQQHTHQRQLPQLPQQHHQLQHQRSLQSLRSKHAAAYYQSNRSSSMEKPNTDSTVQNMKCSYPGFPSFVTEDATYEVRLKRDLRGLGLSVTGGLDSQENYPGLIRIKKVFPMGPAFQSGRLQPWDIILRANGVPLTGLTNHEALEVLRTTPMETILTICRPPPNIPGFFDTTAEYLQSQTSNQSQTQIQSSHNQFPIQNLHQQHQQQQRQQQHHHQQQQQQHHHQQHQLSQQHHRQLHQPHCPHQLNYQKQMHLLQHQHSQQLQPQVYRNEGHPSVTSSSSLAFHHQSTKSKSLSSLKIPSQSQNQNQSLESYGEFEVTLEKIGGSLGFTLRQEDSSVLGHYVRALVKDPALSDGRIQPGDRILSVNGQDLSEMSHGDAISFLRQCSPKVKLRLYRDVSPTPISPLSPTESHKVLKAKPFRQEALDMLNDLALRKQMSSSGSDPKHSLPGSAVGRTGLRGHKVPQQDDRGPATLPRRRPAPGPGVTPSPEVLSAALDRFAGKATQKSNKTHSPESVNSGNKSESNENHVGSGGGGGGGNGGVHLQHSSHHHNYPAETRSSGSGESTPAGTIIQPRSKKTDRYKSYELRPEDTDTSSTNTCKTKDEIDHSDSEVNEPSRKPSFRQFTLHLDRISSLEDDNSFSSDLNHHDSIVSEPGFGSAHNSPSHRRDGSNFRHGQPAYQSAILPSTTKPNKMRCKGTKLTKEDIGSGFRLGGGDSTSALSDIDIPSTLSSTASQDTQQTSLANQLKGTKSKTSDVPCSSSSASGTSTSGSTKAGGLLKWKGVLFSQDDNDDDDDFLDDEDLDASFRHPVGASGGSNIEKNSQTSTDEYDDLFRNSGEGQNGKNHRLPQRRSPDGREFRECDMEISSTTQFNGEQIFTVQLSRRWCSRLGFSLQGSEGHTFISAIYPDSVAAKDGRLRVGDEVIMINGETVRDVETPEVIDMMRKIRGVISITLLRKPDSEPETNPSDHQLGLT